MVRITSLLLLLLATCPLQAIDLFVGDHEVRLDVDPAEGIVITIALDNRETMQFLMQHILRLSKPRQTSCYLHINSRTGDNYYRFPYAVFSAYFKRRIIEILFPQDRWTGNGWLHTVRCLKPDVSGTLADISLWFTGTRDNARAIMRANHLTKTACTQGQRVLVPKALLLPVFQTQRVKGEVVIAVRSVNDKHADKKLLQYGRDRQGDYALYHLKKHEALYSSVVVRFTGVTRAEDVMELARLIAKRSGITRVNDIPVGHGIKIPQQYLMPEFLPAGSKTRIQDEQHHRQVAQYEKKTKAPGLKGVHVILDAGHGGHDPGAYIKGISEHEQVYDIVCRLKQILETRSQAKVYVTVKDTRTGFALSRKGILPRNRKEVLLTSPTYNLGDSKVGVNLRWYLANYTFLKLKQAGVADENIVFLSIHADSLYKSLSGSTIYLADARYIKKKKHGKSGWPYRIYREVKYRTWYTYPWKLRVRSQALSQSLGNGFLSVFHKQDIPVYKNKPLRGYVIRSRRRFVPAVIRYSIIPTKMLIEVGNMNNTTDRKNITDYRFRQRFAEALYAGLCAFFK